MKDFRKLLPVTLIGLIVIALVFLFTSFEISYKPKQLKSAIISETEKCDINDHLFVGCNGFY